MVCALTNICFLWGLGLVISPFWLVSVCVCFVLSSLEVSTSFSKLNPYNEYLQCFSMPYIRDSSGSKQLSSPVRAPQLLYFSRMAVSAWAREDLLCCVFLWGEPRTLESVPDGPAAKTQGHTVYRRTGSPLQPSSPFLSLRNSCCNRENGPWTASLHHQTALVHSGKFRHLLSYSSPGLYHIGAISLSDLKAQGRGRERGVFVQLPQLLLSPQSKEVLEEGFGKNSAASHL